MAKPWGFGVRVPKADTTRDAPNGAKQAGNVAAGPATHKSRALCCRRRAPACTANHAHSVCVSCVRTAATMSCSSPELFNAAVSGRRRGASRAVIRLSCKVRGLVQHEIWPHRHAVRFRHRRKFPPTSCQPDWCPHRRWRRQDALAGVRPKVRGGVAREPPHGSRCALPPPR